MHKNRFVYLVLILYGGLFIKLYNRYQTFLVYLLICSIPAFMIVLLLFLRKDIHLNHEKFKTLQGSSSSVDFIIEIENRSRLLPLTHGIMEITMLNTITGEMKEEHVLFTAKHKDISNIRLIWNGNYSGIITLLIRKVKIYDYFGLFSLKLCKKDMEKYRGKKAIVITSLKLPKDMLLKKIPEGQNTDESSDNELYAKHRAGDDPIEIYDMHDYREGDKLNRIHWKLSYKRGTYVVKDYGYPISSNASILIDFCDGCKDKYDFLEGVFQTVYNISLSMIRENIPHDIIWYHNEYHKLMVSGIDTRADLERFFRDLFTNGCFFEEDPILVEYLNYSEDRHSMQEIYISKGRLSEEKLQMLEQKKIEDINLLCVVEEDKTKEVTFYYSDHILLTMLRIAHLEDDIKQWQDKIFEI